MNKKWAFKLLVILILLAIPVSLLFSLDNSNSNIILTKDTEEIIHKYEVAGWEVKATPRVKGPYRISDTVHTFHMNFYSESDEHSKTIRSLSFPDEHEVLKVSVTSTNNSSDFFFSRPRLKEPVFKDKQEIIDEYMKQGWELNEGLSYPAHINLKAFITISGH